MRVVVTGANGFVGTALCRIFEQRGLPYTALLRPGRSLELDQKIGTSYLIDDLFNIEQLDFALQGATSVVHLAARVHKPGETDASLYYRDNVEMTRTVLEASAKTGVKHFIYLSTIKVYGEFQDQEFTVDSPCHPLTPYGDSKLAAETLARDFCSKHHINLDIIRIPLVIGEQAKGNLGTVAKLLKLGLPLPLGGIRNRRSFVRLSHLTDFICERIVTVAKVQATGEVWIHAVTEKEPVSTPGLLALFASQRGIQIRYLWLPSILIHLACFVLDFVQGNAFSNKNQHNRSVDKILGNAVLQPGSKRDVSKS